MGTTDTEKLIDEGNNTRHFANRVELALKARKKTKSYLARCLKISSQHLNYLLKEAAKPKFISEISLALNINPVWLRTGMEPMLAAQSTSEMEVCAVPIYEMSEIEESFTKNLNQDGREVVLVSVLEATHSLAVKLTDISMEPTFKKGWILIFDQEKTPQQEDYVLVRVDKKKLLFRQFIADGLSSCFVPHNSMYEKICGSDYKIYGVLIEARMRL